MSKAIHTCTTCGDPIPNGTAHIRSVSFEQVAYCDFCHLIRQAEAFAEVVESDRIDALLAGYGRRGAA